jgi:hypothetical protein
MAKFTPLLLTNQRPNLRFVMLLLSASSALPLAVVVALKAFLQIPRINSVAPFSLIVSFHSENLDSVLESRTSEETIPWKAANFVFMLRRLKSGFNIPLLSQNYLSLFLTSCLSTKEFRIQQQTTTKA